MRLLRNFTRRKARTTLTIVGISVGIWALVVMGSMANKIGALVEGGSTYFADKIIVSDASNPVLGFIAFNPLPLKTADMVLAVPGVAVVVPEVSLLLDPEETGRNGFGLPDFISGSVAGADQGREAFELNVTQGRLLTTADEGSNVVVLGSDLARKFKKRSPDTMVIRGHEFSVVGILEPTLTAPDTTALLPLEAAQRLLGENLPLMARRGLEPHELVSQIVVYPDYGVDVESLATDLEGQFDQVQAMTGGEFDEEIGSTTALFNAIILGVALISLVVGGLSVINTMAMSVAERTREIGIKRAIGASKSRIMREIVFEAGLIGLIGGIIGLVLGITVVLIANHLGRSSGTILFALTADRAIFAVVFSAILGMVAGLMPAWNAARLDPVQALRHE